MFPSSIFKDRSLVIATMHGKERVIAPPLVQAFNAKPIVPTDFDTDALGTFSGEVSRNLSPKDAAILKCNMAMDRCNLDLAIASEGSFGAHPSLYFTAADEEWLVLVDRKYNLEITVRELSLETNFASQQCNFRDELQAFANQALFPSHALIIRKSISDYSYIQKGVTNWEQLFDGFKILEKYGSAYVETDMRAMYNPTRMGVIAKTTGKLIQLMQSLCPHCSAPGYSVKQVVSGLPCELCQQPTRSTLYHFYICQVCQFSTEKYFPNGKELEDAGYCDFCNP